MSYTPPVDSMRVLLHHVIDYPQVQALPAYKDASSELADAILHEAAKFASNVLAPLNRVGDQQGAVLKDGEVVTPDGFKQAYQQFYQNGWNALACEAEHGGQGMPYSVAVLVSEMWSGANMAFALCPLLTQSGVELLSHYGSQEQKETYLVKLVSGEWTGTMCLTEPQAGSDVGALATKAVKEGEHYRISGQKIYITYGDHDLTENIVHLVLARTEDAPKGSKGISLFIVPKVLEDGTQNDVRALSLEHKLGIHASPTAVMAFDAAVGYLLGEENAGLKYMFTMMNHARLAVGIEGVAIAENSLQQASAYAKERVQGHAIDGSAHNIAIINHPDTALTLHKIQAEVLALRALIVQQAWYMDMAKYSENEEDRSRYSAFASFLTPIVKAHGTDRGFSLSSEALQVFGGMGYVEETGIAQNVRDSRIAPIYEGTNGIQALDLVMRKLPLLEEGIVPLLLDHIAAGADHASLLLSEYAQICELVLKAPPQKKAVIASDFLTYSGIVLGGVMMHRYEKAVDTLTSTASGFEVRLLNHIHDASQIYHTRLLPHAHGYSVAIKTALK